MLGRDFFARDAETVARDLLGATLVVDGHRVRVVETEAYVGPHDAACHARVGVTDRTRVLHGPAGHAYVYLVYGMHHLLNVVTGPEGHGEAVLIRAVEPLGPLDPTAVPGRTDGPGRLTKTLNIRVGTHDGLDLCGPEAQARGFYLEAGTPPAADRVVAGPRVGVEYAGDWAHAPLRFCDADSRCLSKPAHHAPRHPAPATP